MNENYLVYSGALSWNHPHWHDNFYPADMPPQWLLPYYNTRFKTVYLPWQEWETLSDAEIAQWLEDTQEAFRFLLEVGQDEGEILRCQEKFAGRALVVTPSWADQHLLWLPAKPDLRALAKRITEHASLGRPLFAISREGDLNALEQVGTLVHVLGY
jgi:hypothetical protein